MKRVMTSNGYGNCPDLARLIAGRVGPGLVLEVGRVEARCSARVAEPGRRLSTGLGDLYEAVRGRGAL